MISIENRLILHEYSIIFPQDILYDVFERQGMHLSNGEIVYTNPYAADSDGDGLLDGEEIIQEFHMFGHDALAQFNPNNIYFTFNGSSLKSGGKN